MYCFLKGLQSKLYKDLLCSRSSKKRRFVWHFENMPCILPDGKPCAGLETWVLPSHVQESGGLQQAPLPPEDARYSLFHRTFELQQYVLARLPQSSDI